MSNFTLEHKRVYAELMGLKYEEEFDELNGGPMWKGLKNKYGWVASIEDFNPLDRFNEIWNSLTNEQQIEVIKLLGAFTKGHELDLYSIKEAFDIAINGKKETLQAIYQIVKEK